MPFFPSIGGEYSIPDVLKQFNTGTGSHLLKLHQVLLRSEGSPFTVAERELMAAYVSAVNACDYCAGSHEAVAELYGISTGFLAGLLDDLAGADVASKLKPVLAYIRKLTETPSRMIQADADAVYAAGWDERALYDAIQVCCLYNFMNRFADGIGLVPVPELFSVWGAMIKKDGYDGMIEDFRIK